MVGINQGMHMNEAGSAPTGDVAIDTGLGLAPSGPAAPAMPALAVGDDGWQVTTPAPWRRYFGRMFDLTVLGALVWACIGFMVAFLDAPLYDRLFAEGSIVNNLVVSTILTCIVVLPVLAIIIGMTGSSPGKWLFGTRVTRRDGRPIGIMAALKRELDVLVRGLGLGIPLISLGTLLWSRSSLDDHGAAGWDRHKPWVVTHREKGSVQTLLFVVGLLAWIAVRVALQLIS